MTRASRRKHNGRLVPLPRGTRHGLVSVQEAVRLLAERGMVVDESTIRRALASGRIAGDKPGRDWLVDTRSLQAFSLRRAVPRKEAVNSP